MTTRIVKTALLLLPFMLVFEAVHKASADYYKYKDASGTVCITNKLQSVPPRYRATMQVIRDDTAGKEPAAHNQPEPSQPAVEPTSQKPAQESPAEGRFGQLSARYPWFKPLAIIGGILAGFVVVTKLAGLLPSPHLARLIYLAFFLGVFVFAYKSYADHVAEGYFSIKQKVVAMFTKANEREGLQPENKPAGAAAELPEKPQTER